MSREPPIPIHGVTLGGKQLDWHLCQVDGTASVVVDEGILYCHDFKI